jgi:hypothetical protein
MCLRKKTDFREISIKARELPCLHKDAQEHRAIKPSCVRVAQRRMVAAQKIYPTGKSVAGTVGEAVG